MPTLRMSALIVPVAPGVSSVSGIVMSASPTQAAPPLNDSKWLNIDGSYASIQQVVNNGVPQPKRSLYRLVERLLGLLTTHYVAGSRFIRDVGVRRRVFRPDRASVIHYSSRAEPGDAGPGDRARLRAEWLSFAAIIGVLPSLVLNYLGQGALLIAHPEAIENPFFLLFPAWSLVPVVIMATFAPESFWR